MITTLITVIVVGIGKGTREPEYDGVGLSQWLDGTMFKKGGSPMEMRELKLLEEKAERRLR
jgi:hypothetical protein